MEQMDLFDIEVVSYPRVDNLKLSLRQVEYIINALEVYNSKLEGLEERDHEFELFRNKEHKDIETIIEYLDSSIQGVSRRNKAINKSKLEQNLGIDPFNQIGDDIDE